ncbi:marvel domain-containing protein [Bisporella sp. PMI_857]|nr:marvel domain-containing protein [Bisporella sp. PMI_857]
MILTLGIRGLQILFSAVVLALSAVLVAQYGPGSAPALLKYGAFCGGCALLFGLIGVAACFFDKLQGIIMLALDGLASLFLVAGGIAFAATIKVGDCGDKSVTGYLLEHYKTFGADPNSDRFKTIKNGKIELLGGKYLDDMSSRCRMVQADTALLWFTFACVLAATILGSLGSRRGEKGGFIV